MRIVQVVTRRQRRGAETFAAQLSDALVDRGHEVFLVGLYAPPSDPLVPNRAQVVDVGAKNRSALDLRLLSQFADRLSALQPDIVQANGSDTLKYSVLARLRLGARWPLIYRNISIGSRWLRYPGHRLWVRWLLSRADFIVAVSEGARVDLERSFALPPSRIRTIPIGTAIPAELRREETRRRIASEVGVSETADLLLHIGSFSPEKNHLWLLECFEAISAQREDAHLLLVGDGNLRSTVQKAVEERNLGRRVHFLGTRSDAAQLTAGVDLLLLPSLIEGIPGVILEAAAHGTPCVATDVGSISEAVIDGVSGILVPVGRKDLFVEAVVSLLADGARRDAFGTAARAHISRSYAMPVIVEAFDGLYAELTSSGSGVGQEPPRPVVM